MRCARDDNLLFNRKKIGRNLDYATGFADCFYGTISESAYLGVRHSYFHEKLSLVHIVNELLCAVDQVCDGEHEMCAHECWWLAGSIASYLIGLTKDNSSISVYISCSGCWGLGGTPPASLRSYTNTSAGAVDIAKFSVQNVSCKVFCVPFNTTFLGEPRQRSLMYDLFICHVMACFDISAARCALRFDAEKIGEEIKPCEFRTHGSPKCVHHYKIDFIDLTSEVPKIFIPRAVCNAERLRKYSERQIFQPLIKGPTELQQKVLQRMILLLERDD